MFAPAVKWSASTVTKRSSVRDLAADTEYTESYDALILSPGAEPFARRFPASTRPRVFTLRNIADMDAIMKRIDRAKPERAVVIGGGYIGLEMAEALTNAACRCRWWNWNRR